MKRKAPLVVVATMNPDTVSKEKLAKFTTPEGDFLTLARLKHVFSPFTGKEINASSGVLVAEKINDKDAVGIICQSCKSVNATTDKARSEMYCVTCGTHMKYDLASGEELDQDELEDFSEESEFEDIEDEDIEDIEDEDMIGGDDIEESEAEEDAPLDDYMEDEEVESKKSCKAESEDEEVIDMTDTVNEDEEVSFVKLNDSVVALVSGMIVASLPAENENSELVLTSGFRNGFKSTVALKGLKKALVSAGFKTKKIVVSDVIKAATIRNENEVKRQVAKQVKENQQRFAKCLEIAAAGGLVGMFAKEESGVMLDKLSKTLSVMNVKNYKKVAKQILSTALPLHNKAMLNIASSLMDKKQEILSTYEEQISNMDGTLLIDPDYSEDEEMDTVTQVESRLADPFRNSATKGVEMSKTKDDESLTGLFTVA